MIKPTNTKSDVIHVSSFLIFFFLGNWGCTSWDGRSKIVLILGSSELEFTVLTFLFFGLLTFCELDIVVWFSFPSFFSSIIITSFLDIYLRTSSVIWNVKGFGGNPCNITWCLIAIPLLSLISLCNSAKVVDTGIFLISPDNFLE